MDEFNAKFDNKLRCYADYREMLEQEKPQIVTIGTPDHWHVPIAIAALRAGCDVYCEKPLTLTIEEGFRIRKAVKETGKVFQVGTQQRSEYRRLVSEGDRDRARAAGSARRSTPTSPSAAARSAGRSRTSPSPKASIGTCGSGPANKADYSPERRKEFRWFFDYSGGKMTDWGAHHIDIAQWALGHDHTGPVKVSSATSKFTPLVPDKFDWHAYFAGKAKLPNGYQTATKFDIKMEYADGSTITVRDEYVSRGRQDASSPTASCSKARRPHLRQPREAHRQAGRRHDQSRAHRHARRR